MEEPTIQINSNHCVYVEIAGYTICIDTSIPRDGISVRYWKENDGGATRGIVGSINLPNTEAIAEVDGWYAPATNQPTLYVSPEETYGE